MSEDSFGDFDRRMAHSISNSWRRHHQVGGRRQLLGGAIATLIAVCLLIPGIDEYVGATYSVQDGNLSLALLLIISAGIALATGLVLSCIGYLNRRKAERRVLTYDDVM